MLGSWSSSETVALVTVKVTVSQVEETESVPSQEGVVACYVELHGRTWKWVGVLLLIRLLKTSSVHTVDVTNYYMFTVALNMSFSRKKTSDLQPSVQTSCLIINKTEFKGNIYI